MDFRPFGFPKEHCELAAQLLSYQPFFIAPDLQTGFGYSWLHTKDPRVTPPLVFRRSEWEAEWDKITAANERVRRMYDGFIRFIADHYPGGTLLDVACNTGYFPVRAEMFGMGPSAGMDAAAHYAASIQFLNVVCRTHARFTNTAYDPATHTAPGLQGWYDVVVASKILCHLPDPTYFLAFLGRLAGKAIFMWDAFIDSDDILIHYRKPNFELGHAAAHTSYPLFFNDSTRITRGLLELAFRSMGFKKIVYLPWSEDWMPQYGLLDYTPPTVSEDLPKPLRDDFKLFSELRQGAKEVAVLAMR